MVLIQHELKNGYIGERMDVISLTLDKSSLVLTTVGQTEQITATVDPVGAKVTWSSSDTTVATVDSTGLVTCVNPGSCTITAESFGVTATCNVMNAKLIDFLLIGGGGYGGTGSRYTGGGGGGAGGYIECCGYTVTGGAYSVVVGASYQSSSFDGMTANGGCNAGYVGGGSGNGYSGGWCSCRGGGGGAGAGGNGGGGQGCTRGGTGGIGFYSSMSGSNQPYAGGGGGGGACEASAGSGQYGGGSGGPAYGGAGGGTTCGSGGGGGGQCGYGGSGAGGLFIVRYPTSSGYDITGGTCYTCGDYTIHCFTSSGTLCVN